MPRYALIDSHSGYVWGTTDAADPIAAAQAVDAEVDPSDAAGREYREITASDRGVDHYAVYDATTLAQDVTDGQDEAQIEAVRALPLVALVAWN